MGVAWLPGENLAGFFKYAKRICFIKDHIILFFQCFAIADLVSDTPDGVATDRNLVTDRLGGLLCMTAAGCRQDHNEQ